MREITCIDISEKVAEACVDACHKLPDSVLEAFDRAAEEEISPLGRGVLKKLRENDEIARKRNVSYCHDTGMTIIYAEVGQEVQIVGGLFEDALQEGVRIGYKKGYLRKSVVADPLLRINSDDNTPAVTHVRLVGGDNIKITVVPKGGGSENWSTLKILLPGVGVEGVIDFVVETVAKAGAAACPPLTVGVGIGGSFDKVADLAKEAILRDIGKYSQQKHIAELEKTLLDKINMLGIGPMGFGGKTTALWVAVETFGCHITALPVAVNIQCHAARRKTVVI